MIPKITEQKESWSSKFWSNDFVIGCVGLCFLVGVVTLCICVCLTIFFVWTTESHYVCSLTTKDSTACLATTEVVNGNTITYSF